MPQGLQVWDASGNLILDTSDSVGRLLGSFTASGTSGSVVNSGLTTGTPFWFTDSVFTSWGAYEIPSTFSNPKITVAGSTLSWTRTNSASSEPVPSCTVYYGVY